MCGILGTVNVPFDAACLDLLAHRGPDDAGLDTVRTAGEEVHLGHRRLSILDLSAAGRQPMASACGRWRIVFNGEIYNHRELRGRLRETSFRGHSDTETIVNDFAARGIGAVADFNGIFALGLLDIDGGRVYLARDRFGVKPLYYVHDPARRRLIFASELKPVLALAGDRDIDLAALNTYLTLRYNPAPRTLFHGVRKLAAGEVLELDLASFRLRRVLELTRLEAIETDRRRSEDDWAHAVGAALEAAVERQMLSDVPVGCFLSGGLDSALIAAIATRHTRGRLQTFCVGFRGGSRDEDESADARRSAAWIGTEHHEVSIDPAAYMDFFEDSIAILEEPNGTAATLAQLEVSRLARQHVTVALAGQGADELFMGYPRYAVERWRRALLPALWLAAKVPGLVAAPRLHRVRRALQSLPEPVQERRFVDIVTVFSAAERRRLFRPETAAALDGDWRPTDLDPFCDRIPRALPPVERLAILDTYTSLCDELLLYGDKMTMATSLEMRVPFLDNDLAALVHAIPWQLKIRGRRGKHVLRRVARKWLPREIIDRPKRGFVMPILRWFQGDLNERLFDLLVRREARIHRYLEPDAVAALIRAYRSRRERDHRKLFLLMQLEFFLRRFA